MSHPLKWLKERFMEAWAGPVRWAKRLTERFMANPAGPMQWWKRVILFFWFLIIGGLSVYFVYGLWAAEPKTVQVRPAAEPEYKVEEKPTDDKPKIKLIDPQTVTIGIGQASIRIFGYNFKKESNVKFNEATRLSQYVNDHQLVVPLARSNFVASGVLATPGAVAVKVVNGDKSSDAVTLMVEAAASTIGEWYVFGRLINIRQEPRLILIVLFTGALGACMYALKSLADYIGERKLTESWFIFYMVRPLLGAGIAFVFYLVIRGGFLGGTNFDAATVNPFGLAAAAALVGMFSDRAFAKLREVFLALFRPDDTRSDILSTLAITTGRKLPDATAGDLYKETLTAGGGTPL
jgi:hypothetical protein